MCWEAAEIFQSLPLRVILVPNEQNNYNRRGRRCFTVAAVDTWSNQRCPARPMFLGHADWAKRNGGKRFCEVKRVRYGWVMLDMWFNDNVIWYDFIAQQTWHCQACCLSPTCCWWQVERMQKVFTCRFTDVASPKQDSQSADVKTCGCVGMNVWGKEDERYKC